MARIFLLSPAYCGGERAHLIYDRRAQFALARKLRSSEGAALGDVFSFLSGLYFRGKLAYAQAFADPPNGIHGVLIITPNSGLKPAEDKVTLEQLRRYSAVPIDCRDPRYKRPLLRDATTLSAQIGSECDVVLLGSVATGKYVDILLEIFGRQLRFPVEFVGRGDMSRGGLMLRCVREQRELEYISVMGAVRHGKRPPKLTAQG